MTPGVNPSAGTNSANTCAGGGARGHRRNRRARREAVHKMPTPQPVRGGVPINNRGSTRGLALVEMDHASCSGVFVSPNHVVTAQHIVTKGKKFEGGKGTAFLGFEAPGTIKVRFPQRDRRTQVHTQRT